MVSLFVRKESNYEFVMELENYAGTSAPLMFLGSSLTAQILNRKIDALVGGYNSTVVQDEYDYHVLFDLLCSKCWRTATQDAALPTYRIGCIDPLYHVAVGNSIIFNTAGRVISDSATSTLICKRFPFYLSDSIVESRLSGVNQSHIL
ncbi:hypothetical protein Nepgr_014927 [Nepenthes gracilis]|uniref:Uncharacterized protein n=1 Tax=Nepenthes gracilis TaxID=150966 RepID=A0AAD3SM39_NEPGR|nr:hypothetical protein Nepgr_014927 [Nepenthes gracilis]